MSKESTYIIVPVGDKDGRSRDLYRGSDTVGSCSAKSRPMQTLKLTLVPMGSLFQILVRIRCVTTTHVEIILQIRKERWASKLIYLKIYAPSQPIQYDPINEPRNMTIQGKSGTYGGTKRRLNPASGCIRVTLDMCTRGLGTNRSVEKCQRWALMMSFRQGNTATFEEALE